MEQIYFSDHLPIEICINERTQMGSVYNGQPRWKYSGVDWKAYTKAIESSVKLLELRQNLKELSEEFKNIITDAAERHVGKTKPGKGKVSWVTQAVLGTINKMINMRKNVSNNRKEWLDSCQVTIMVINHAKEEAWRGVLE